MVPRAKSEFGERLTPLQEWGRAALTSGPRLAWIGLFLLVPLLAIIAISFASRGTYAELEWRFSLENYARFFGFTRAGYDPLYLRILLRSLGLAAVTTVLCILVGLPLTFFIARLPRRFRHWALILVVIPFWTNLLVRTYAWQILFSGSGWIAAAAAALGLSPPGEALFPSAVAVLTAMTCDFLPLLALPLYTSVEKIDWSLAEAASDLGASRWPIFRHALLPQIKPGLSAGGLLVFIAATGQFVIPDLLGGSKTVLLGNAVQQQFGFSRNWPFGAAIACAAMAIVLGALWWFSRSTGEEGRKAML